MLLLVVNVGFDGLSGFTITALSVAGACLLIGIPVIYLLVAYRPRQYPDATIVDDDKVRQLYSLAVWKQNVYFYDV